MSKVRGWYRPRSYCHFDFRLLEVHRGCVEAYVSNAKNIVTHPFLPLVSYEKIKYSVKPDADGNRRIDRSSKRPISYASHWGSQILAYYSTILSGFYEKELLKRSLSNEVIAFRCLVDPNDEKPMDNIRHAYRAFRDINRIGECDVFAFDIKKFFDRLNQKRLKIGWGNLLGTKGLPEDHYKVWRFLTEAASIDRSKINSILNAPGRKQTCRKAQLCTRAEFASMIRPNLKPKRELGIPQGTPISAMLANIYMLDVDTALSNAIRAVGGSYYRYCDDILVIVPRNTGIDVETIVSSQISSIELELNTGKSEKAVFRLAGGRLQSATPIQYLGFIFDGHSISVRPGSISKQLAKAKAAVTQFGIHRTRSNKERERQGKLQEALYTKELNRRHRHFGRRSFSRYLHRAIEVMNSPALVSQAKKYDRHVKTLIDNARLSDP